MPRPTLFLLALSATCFAQTHTIDGYKGIWFDLGERREFGSKYSGGIGTRTAKNCPMAVYSEEADKTFFVYGGTPAAKKHHPLAMLSHFDHKAGTVPKPVVVHDKQDFKDPYDNLSLNIDGKGHIWVFVSGRGRKHPGHVYRSAKPYDITTMKHMEDRDFSYPQPWWVPNQGFVMFFTRYSRGRELFVSRSHQDGAKWGEDEKLAAMGGHNQVSFAQDKHLITAFNMHPSGNVNHCTNLYFMQSHTGGKTWLDIHGTKLFPPLTKPKSPALVRDYASEGRLVFVKDIATDWMGQPVILYVTATLRQTDSKDDPRIWTIARWNGEKWGFHEITSSTHNDDMGSLYLGVDEWKFIAPTHPGPQKLGTGGEIASWVSSDEGKTWEMERQLTKDSERNHGYVRRAHHAHPDFIGFWTDGNPNKLSESHLYIMGRDGKVSCLPYEMQQTMAKPAPLKP